VTRAILQRLGAASGLGLLIAVTAATPVPAQPTHTIDLADVHTDARRFGRVHGSSGAGVTGVPVAGGFDIDGDGFTDHALAAMRASPLGRSKAGEVHLIFGDGGFLGTIDSAVTSTDILRIYGAGLLEATGSEVWMDDVTGDGLGDLLIGRQNYTPHASRIGAGAVTVVVGSSALRELAAEGSYLDLAEPPLSIDTVTFIGAAEGDRVGIWLRSGDVTGDGVSDLLFAADQEDGPGQNDRGALYLVRGGFHLSSRSTIDLVSFGATAFVGHLAKIVPPAGSHEYHFGSTCALGDLDANDRAEVLASAALNRAGATLHPAGAQPGSAHGLGGSLDGTAFIVWDDNFPVGDWAPGYTIALDAAPGSVTIIDGANANNKFGEELLAGLDYDNNGMADLFVGDITGDLSQGGNRPASGSGHVIYDAAVLKGLTFDLESPPEGFAKTTIVGAAANDIAADTAAHGDFDGDMLADLIVSSPHALTAGRSSAGTLHVFFGGARWPERMDLRSGLEPSSQDVRFTLVQGAFGTSGSDNGDTLCYSAAYGDVDGDGRTDLIGNEMLGNGLAPEHEDVGNLIVLSGEMLAGSAGSGCPLRPASECLVTLGDRSRLRIVNRPGRSRDRLVWRWGDGEATSVADYLAPDSNPKARFALCLYSGDEPQFDGASADVPSLGTCNDQPCWIAHESGFRYADTQALAAGVRAMRLRAGDDGAAYLYARAGGENLELPVGPLAAPVVMQLRATDDGADRCWQSTFTAFKRNDAQVLRALGE